MKRKLSTARSRADLISSHAYGQALASPPPPPAADAPPEKPAPAPADADAAVTSAIAEIKAAVAKAQAAQKDDPDTADPNDEKVTAALDQIAQAVADVEKDQAADAAAEPEDTDKPPAPEKPPVTAAGTVPAQPEPVKGGDAPNANPVDDAGNVDDGVVCATPDCGHLASAHTNTSTGDNTGACSMLNCGCEAMNVEADPTGAAEDDDEDGSGDGPAPAKQPVKLAAPVPDAPVAPGPAASDAPSSDLNAPPPAEGSENMGPAFTIPVLIIEGQPTGDGRQIAPNALTWRVPPLPLMGLATETHDPEGWDLNDPAVICGRIDSLERVPGEGDTQLIVAKGFYLPNDDGMYFAGLTEAMGRCGISGDVAVQSSEIEVGEVDADGWPMEMSEILTEGSIMGATQVPFPAFEGAYIVLGDGSEQPDATAIPQTADEPATPDKPPAAVTAGGQLVHFMSYEQCAACDQGFEVIVAAGGPTRPPKAWFANPNFTEDDGRLVEILDRRGKRAMGGKYACPVTVTADGRVFGHIAPWDVCHTGVSGQCILAPHSAVDYAHFKRGQQITTAEGEQIRVGVLTADTGHASTRPGVSAAAAMAHYDNTALAAADVNIGEDEYGIWIAGAMRPDASEEQVRKLTAASISGDWRNMGGRLELVAALAVNQPGFPLAVVADGRVESLVAAGASVMHRVKHPAEPASVDSSASLLKALSGLLPVAAKSARDRIEALR